MRIGFIGAGSMVAAIARGAVAAGMNGYDFIFTDLNRVHAPALAAELGASTARSNTALAREVDILILGVKPNVQPKVINSIAHIVREREDMCVVSLAAGRTMDAILEDFGAVERLMNAVGRTVRLSEKEFPAFQALASCAPAWIFQIIESLARAGVKHGLAKDAATVIAAQALAGSADLVLDARDRGIIPSGLIDQVCSPGGTTIVGLLAAQEAGLSTSLVKAVEAAIAKDAEISARAG